MTRQQLAVVTGASSGIGLELARQFAQHGFDLIICSNSAAIEMAQSELQAEGVSVETVEADLGSRDGVDELVRVVESGGRPVDALAINAGIGVGGDFVGGTDLGQELQLINLNVTGSVTLAKMLLPAMKQRGAGRVLFTSSIAATMPAPWEAVYGASKAFLLSFSEALRRELEDTGVTVTALMPGPTETNFFHRAQMDDTKVGQDDSKDSAADVARDGYEALMAGKDKVVAGSSKNALQALAGRITPDPVKASLHGSLSKPGSGKQ